MVVPRVRRFNSAFEEKRKKNQFAIQYQRYCSSVGHMQCRNMLESSLSGLGMINSKMNNHFFSLEKEISCLKMYSTFILIFLSLNK